MPVSSCVSLIVLELRQISRDSDDQSVTILQLELEVLKFDSDHRDRRDAGPEAILGKP